MPQALKGFHSGTSSRQNFRGDKTPPGNRRGRNLERQKCVFQDNVREENKDEDCQQGRKTAGVNHASADFETVDGIPE